MSLVHQGKRVWLMAAGVAATLLLLFPAAGMAAVADEARYSLGSVQLDDELRVPGDGEVTTSLLFYNIDGNVPTELELVVVQAPAGWNVTLGSPSLQGSGTSALSLRVAPSAVLAEPLSCPGEVLLPPRGYVCAEVVDVRIVVPPQSARTQGLVRVGAVASWLALGGVSPFPQEREFVFNVTVAGTGAARDDGTTVPATSPHRWPTPHSVVVIGVLGLWGVLTLRRALVKSGVVA